VGIAFTIRDPFGTVTDVRGRVGFGGAAVVLQLDPRHTTTGVERKVVIDVEEFVSCSFRRGMLGARIHLWALEEGALGGVPGAGQHGVTLQFARDDRDAAEQLADRVNLAIGEAAARVIVHDELAMRA
jgi:hypothetical protein